MKDAEWIATVLMKGLIRGSYVSDSVIQQLRQYERRVVELNKNIVHAGQLIDMILQRYNIRISNYVSTTDCKGYQKVVDALISGKCSAAELVKLIHKRTINKWGKQVIEDSLEGFVYDSDRDMLEQYRDERNLFETHKACCLSKMEAICEEYYQQEMELLMTIPGIKKQAATTLIAETGVDMEMFLTASAIVGWAGLKPRNEESAGKIKSRKITHGNKYLRKILVEISWGASRKKGSRFNALYYRLVGREKSKQKALIAVARKILVIVWNILSKKQVYEPNYSIRYNAHPMR